MSDLDLYLRLAVALAIGIGVGIERGWKRRDAPDGEREAGIRTFALIALVGAGAALTVPAAGPLLLAATALGLTALIIAMYVISQREEHADHGATTETAAILTFVTGALAGLGQLLAAGLIAAVMIALLDLKDELHALLRRIRDFELTAALKLLLVSVVLLPLMPDRGFGPGGVLNPHTLLWAVVIIATLGFLGYAAMKAAGPERGAIFLGFVGGFMSSTAVTLNASNAARQRPDASVLLATSIATAQGVMFVRTALLVSILNSSLLPVLLWPVIIGTATASAAAFTLFLNVDDKVEKSELAIGSPDQLAPAFEFVAILTGALLLSHYAQSYVGALGIAASSFLAGAFDVDAATVSVSTISAIQPGGEPLGIIAQAAIMSALVANSVVKSVIAFVRGTRVLAWRATIALMSSALAATIALGAQYLMTSR